MHGQNSNTNRMAAMHGKKIDLQLMHSPRVQIQGLKGPSTQICSIFSDQNHLPDLDK